MSNNEPLISIVTPVYNGEQFLEECIKSVLEQSYGNWEYIILDNCSSDNTPDIIIKYAKADTRIKTYRNDSLLPIMDNWNAALAKISSHSEYCKVVHADDWLYPECLSQMARVGERHSTVGVIGSYARWGAKVACDGLPDSEVIAGSEVCKMTLLRQTYPFLSPSVLMIRSSLIRAREPFYPGPNLSADVDVMYQLLRDCSFGYVQQVLSFIRSHESSATATLTLPMKTLLSQRLNLLKKHGPRYLSKTEYKKELQRQLFKYYMFLAKSAWKRKDDEFWEFHAQALQELGQPLSRGKLGIFRLFIIIKRIIKRIELSLMD